MPTTVTTAELAELVRPFIGMRLRGDLSASIEIEAPGMHHANADVRDMRGGYVEVFFYNSCDLVPLASIRRIVIRYKDREGNVYATADYEHVGLREAA